MTSPASCSAKSPRSWAPLGQKDAAQFDQDLFSPEFAYTTEQLMELAGLAVALACGKTYPLNESRRVLVVCGPGNNGGDGLVAARHLKLFGYSPKVIYPKLSDKQPFKNLLTQVSGMGIDVAQDTSLEELDGALFVMDAIFGFSFKGEPRPPYDRILELLRRTTAKICSVDIPSGWDVESGYDASKPDNYIHPDLLVSLTAPKPCAEMFRGRFHYLGGRFVPPTMAERYKLRLPSYPGTDQIVLLD